MENDLPLQYSFINKAKDALLKWAEGENFGIYQIEFVVPFLPSDKDLSVWLFYQSDDMVKRYADAGTTAIVEARFVDIMRDLGYPEDYLSQITFQIDSHENVVANFEGSYFYRLR
jgi:hypothetical protein